ncbi:hypothetical protein IMG5_120230 [Ichthyophthirius multifiliis]|uniref:Peptidase M20 dimerisation domain-containing protein n=1 Tax=Ichthyophthirius multifiliis TaxID=5932 RepID=G0QUZ1_ICHMU|nr:hypothetical protein IMG5_120230 [Ichthyophthirius multifiliis]EGR30960.1 hypothetical protein IMG5_120230 [Ichthyophthirius multifiliis]|eukprot:XP_004032547.1 hypothetical protein IMG5_120230 [Ichthyophthirius multifiliis]
MHQNPETSFKEYQTQISIQDYLIQLGVSQQNIKKIAKTGLFVDLQGRPEPKGEKRTITFRADIDALQMTEQNPHLEYQSVNGAAHMCGHDGHTTCLLGFASLFMEKINEVPSNKTIRLLFQPSEEGPESGAIEMIKDGCLQNVDEVYGFHNWPTHKVGYLMVKPGPVMAQVCIIKLTIIGKGGHGSEPLKAIDPIQAAIDFHIKFRQINEKHKNRQFVCTLPIFQAGERYNVIPQTAFLSGTFRSLENGFDEEFKKDLVQILEEIKYQNKVDYQLDWKNTFPILSNTEKEANDIERIAKEYFGEQNVGFGCMPVKASEDFGFYVQNKPGAFFFQVLKEMKEMLCYMIANMILMKP